MVGGQVEVRVKCKNSVKDPGTTGILRIREEMLLFVPNDPKSDSELKLLTQNIERHKYAKYKEGSKQPPLLNLINKQGRSHIFEFENYPDMHACRDFIAKALAKSEEEPNKSAVSTSSEQLSIGELELRFELPRENSELQRRIPKQFVKSIVLTEDERKSKQQVGRKSMMASGIKPSTDGRTKSRMFNLTTEMIFKIFAEKPAVRQAFIDFVPSKMTNEDFWTKYFRAEYLYSTKKDHGIQRDGTMDVVKPQNDQFRRSLLQDINRHSAVLLEGISIDVESEDTSIVAEALTRVKQVSKADGETTKDADQERLEKLSRVIGMEDLQAPQNFSLAPLSIRDPRDYFESQRGNVLNVPKGAKGLKGNVHEAYGLLIESISEIRATGLSDPLIKPEVSFEVFSSLTRTISTAKNIIGKNPRESFLDRLPKSTKDEVLHHWTSIQELLRHFWSSYPITTTDLHTKVGKLKDAMSNTYSKLEAMKESVQSDHRHQVSLLVRPMQQALDAAFQHYEADLQRRRTTSSGGGESSRSRRF